jgi:hypothetical protein
VVGTIRREWLAVLTGLSALFALATALISNQPAERTWGVFAAGGYGAACLTVLAVRYLSRPAGQLGARRLVLQLGARRSAERGGGLAAQRLGGRLVVLVALGGAVLAPLAWMAATGRAQPEVGVIIRSAVLFLHRGTPYQGPVVLAAAHSPNAYDPYLPALVVFGMPQAMSGAVLPVMLTILTDPRVWFGAVFVVTFGASLAVLGTPRTGWWTAAVTASPVIAFPLSAGGDDLPVLGLLCLGFALLGRDAREDRWYRLLAAGLVLGLAGAMKATAWPALVVALALVAARQGKRAGGLLAAAALGVAVLADGPVVAVAPGATAANTIAFPLGLAKVASPAASVLPGHLIAAAWSGGHLLAIALVVTTGLAVGIWLIVRPPPDMPAAGWRLVIGLTLLFLLAPASRAGYFMYPLGLSVWLLLTTPVTRAGTRRYGEGDVDDMGRDHDPNRPRLAGALGRVLPSVRRHHRSLLTAERRHRSGFPQASVLGQDRRRDVLGEFFQHVQQ